MDSYTTVFNYPKGDCVKVKADFAEINWKEELEKNVEEARNQFKTIFNNSVENHHSGRYQE